ncbi:MAG: DUF2793 domain-containing protein [Sphingomonadales bacterium]|nr:DUF2793 domain-containing protein [Sphingomonadales bacterium]
MTTTPKLGLPYLTTGQAQKEVTHNEALNLIDVASQPIVQNMTTAAPPGSPTNGQAWIVAASPTGAWAGQVNKIATWFDGWHFITPTEGFRVYDLGGDTERFFNGTAWGDATPAANVPSLSLGWIGYGGGFGGPRYYKTPDGRVTIEGLMQAGTDGTVFTLLAGFRPADTLMFGCWSGGGAYRVDVNAAGDVILSGSNTVFSSLSGVSFFAA